MQRGSLILYDNTGKIWVTMGDVEGNVLPHTYPNGLPYIETQFGELDGKIILGVDVSTTPHKLITEDKPAQQTLAERITELENQLLIAEGVI